MERIPIDTSPKGIEENPSPIGSLEVAELNKKIFALQDSLSGRIDETSLNLEQKNKLSRIKENINQASRKILRTMRCVTLAAGTFAMVGQYESTHTDLEVITKSNGTHEYRHEDERTTHLLNVLAGRDSLMEGDLRIDYNSFLTEVANQSGYTFEKPIEEMTIDELDAAMVKLSLSLGEEMESGEVKEQFFRELAFYNTPDTSTKTEVSDDIYELIWQMEKECGNPRIRFASENINFTPIKAYSGSKHYDPLTNTIFIHPEDISPYTPPNTITDEFSHGKQFKEKPIKTVLQYVADIAGVVSRSGFSISKLEKEYNKLYKTPGTVEYGAHHVIEPYLKEKYKLFVKKGSHE